MVTGSEPLVCDKNLRGECDWSEILLFPPVSQEQIAVRCDQNSALDHSFAEASLVVTQEYV